VEVFKVAPAAAYFFLYAAASAFGAATAATLV
ncbi:hypothetical protein Tco_0075282, partial [Tanacetum coccineum]